MVTVLALLAFFAGTVGCVHQVRQALDQWGPDDGWIDDAGDPPPRPPTLDVVVGPTTDLAEGVDVLVTVADVPEGQPVTVTTCPATQEPIVVAEVCHEAGGPTFTVPHGDRLAVIVPARRVVTPAGEDPIDCAGRAGRCMVIAHLADDRWGREPVSFAAGLPPVELVPERDAPVSDLLPARLTPEGPFAVGDAVEIGAERFQPGEALAIGLCSDDAPVDGLLMTCTALSDNLYDLRDVAESPAVSADATGAVTYRTTTRAGVLPEIYDQGPGDEHEEWVDCTERPGRCVLVVAAEVDLQRSAYLPLTITP